LTTEAGEARRYADLHEHVHALARAGLLFVVGEPINKDTEMRPRRQARMTVSGVYLALGEQPAEMRRADVGMNTPVEFEADGHADR
jgi:hypothetical protein